MEEAPENGKELSHSAHANKMNKWTSRIWCYVISVIGHCSTMLMFYIFTLICRQQVAIVSVYPVVLLNLVWIWWMYNKYYINNNTPYNNNSYGTSVIVIDKAYSCKQWDEILNHQVTWNADVISIITLVPLHVLNNLLAWWWPPVLLEIKELKLC